MSATPTSGLDRRVTRGVYGAFVVVITVFVATIIAEVAGQLFGAGGPERPVALSGACERGVRDLAAAVDRAVVAGADAEEVEAALARYRSARDAEWTKKDAIAATCAEQPRGADAMAALARLDRQAEGNIRRQTIALRPVRREVDSFISTPR